MCTCVYMYIYIYMHVYIQIYIHTHTRTYLRTRTCIYAPASSAPLLSSRPTRSNTPYTHTWHTHVTQHRTASLALPPWLQPTYMNTYMDIHIHIHIGMYISDVHTCKVPHTYVYLHPWCLYPHRARAVASTIWKHTPHPCVVAVCVCAVAWECVRGSCVTVCV